MPSSSGAAVDVNVVQDGSMLHLILEGKDLFQAAGWFGSTDPFYTISSSDFAPNGSVVWQTVYTSEKIEKNLSPRWKEATICMTKLARGHLSRPIRITVKDWEEHSNHILMGTLDTTVQDLVKVSGDASKMAKLEHEGGGGGDYGSLVVRHARVATPRKGISKTMSMRLLTSSNYDPADSPLLKSRSMNKRRATSARHLSGGGRKSSSGSSQRSLESTGSQSTGLNIPKERLLDQTSVFNLTLEGTNLEAVGGWFGQTNPYYQVMRELTDDEKLDVAKREDWKIVHRSEHVQDTVNPIWKRATLPLFFLCQGDLKKKLRITCYSREDAQKSTSMGYFETSVLRLKRALSDPAKEFSLKSNEGKKQGSIRVIEATLPEDFDSSFSWVEMSDTEDQEWMDSSSDAEEHGKKGTDVNNTPREIKLQNSKSRDDEKAKNQLLQSRVAELEMKLREKENLLRSANDKVNRLGSTDGRDQSEVAKELALANATIASTEARVERPTKSILEMEEEKKHLAETYEKRIKAEASRIETLAAEKIVLEQGLAQSQKQAEEYKAKLEAANNQVTKCMQDLEEQKDAKTSLTTSLEEVKEESNLDVFRAEQFVRVKDGVIEHLKSQVSDLESEVLVLEKSLDQTKQEKETTFEEFRKRVLDEVKRGGEDEKAYQERLAEKGSLDRSVLETMLVDAESKVQAHVEKASENVLKIQALSTETASLKAEINVMQGKIGEKKDSVSSSDALVAKLQAECEKAAEQNESLVQSLKDAKAAAHADRKEVSELQKKLVILEGAIETKDGLVDQAHQQKDTLEKERDILRRSLEEEKKCSDAKLEQAKFISASTERDALALQEAEDKIKEMEAEIQSMTLKLSDQEPGSGNGSSGGKPGNGLAGGAGGDHGSDALRTLVERQQTEMRGQSEIIELLQKQIECSGQELKQTLENNANLEALVEEMRTELLHRREIILALESSDESRADTVAKLSDLRNERDEMATRCAKAEKRVKELEVKSAFLLRLRRVLAGPVEIPPKRERSKGSIAYKI